MLRTWCPGGSASLAVSGVVLALLSAAPAHATPILKLDDGRGNGDWSRYVWDQRYLDRGRDLYRDFDGGRHLDRDVYDDFGLSWRGRLGPQYFGDWRWSDKKNGKGRDEVPEPGTLSLLLTALLGGGWLLRARRQQSR